MITFDRLQAFTQQIAADPSRETQLNLEIGEPLQYIPEATRPYLAYSPNIWSAEESSALKLGDFTSYLDSRSASAATLRALAIRLIIRTRIITTEANSAVVGVTLQLLRDDAEHQTKQGHRWADETLSLIRYAHTHLNIDLETLHLALAEVMEMNKCADIPHQRRKGFANDEATLWINTALGFQEEGSPEAVGWEASDLVTAVQMIRREMHFTSISSAMRAIEAGERETKEAIAERDRRIVSACDDGVSSTEISSYAMISNGRISQILKKARTEHQDVPNALSLRGLAQKNMTTTQAMVVDEERTMMWGDPATSGIDD